MAAALRYVEEHPGCTKIAVAAHVRADGETLRNAYAVVDRLVSNRLVTAQYDGRRYSLTVPDQSDVPSDQDQLNDGV